VVSDATKIVSRVGAHATRSLLHSAASTSTGLLSSVDHAVSAAGSGLHSGFAATLRGVKRAFLTGGPGNINPGAVTTIKTAVAGSTSSVTVIGAMAYVTGTSTGPTSLQQVSVSTGVASAFVGSATSSCVNSGNSSTFSSIAGLANDGTNVFVLENGGKCLAAHADIREVTPNGTSAPTVTTLTTSVGALTATSIDYWSGNLYVSNGATIYEVDIATGAVSTFALATAIASGDVYYHLAIDQ